MTNAPWAPRVVDEQRFVVIQSKLDYWCYDFIITTTVCMYITSCRVHKCDVVDSAMMLDLAYPEDPP